MSKRKPTDRMLISIISTLLLFAGAAGVAVGTSTASDVAIKGYDPVAYFRAGKAVRGNESFTATWHKLTWHFVSEKNRDIFVANPLKYAPQYDGYCAWAMTEERKAITDPEVWKIVDEKLYLNCSEAAYEKWKQDIPGNIRKADANWLKQSSSE